MFYKASNKISFLIADELLEIVRPALTAENPVFNRDRFYSNHIQKIKYYVDRREPIQLLLPAFPMKSPNNHKVLGKLPDLAEEISLNFLNEFCEKIKKHYDPGAELTICSDGRVFGDVIGVKDQDITNYQHQLKNLIKKINAKYISVVNLEDFEEFYELNFDLMREKLVNYHADSLSEIKSYLLSSDDGLRLYRAMSRFLFEDSLTPEYSGSKNALQNDAKKRAIETIQRSWAWGNFLEIKFPKFLRLSIHPQPDSAEKIGIHMMPTKDNWLTPWHGVAAEINNQFILMKKTEAISLNGSIVIRDEKLSHYKIPASPEADLYL